MNRFLKTLLLWLLLAALPFQGIAAVMKAACGPTELNGSTGVAISTQSHHHHHGETGHVAHAAVADDNTAMKSGADNPSDAKHPHSACSACASCCVGAVAPPFTPDSISSRSGSLPVVTSPFPLVTSVVPEGLERPPKRITA